jgi:KaiC/GvpD/RAD55 family RecA-like ATPase
VQKAICQPTDYQPTNEKAHAVQFYTNDAFLLKGLCEFVRAALIEGQSVVLVVTSAHENALTKHLRLANIKVRTAAKEGRFVTLDALETLATFMDGELQSRRNSFLRSGL